MIRLLGRFECLLNEYGLGMFYGCLQRVYREVEGNKRVSRDVQNILSQILRSQEANTV